MIPNGFWQRHDPVLMTAPGTLRINAIMASMQLT
jgi:hypothetical protein